MCARRFLFLIFFLTMIVVAGAFAIFQFGGRALTEMATPKGHFTAPPPQSGPDYADNRNWLARPGLSEDQSFWRPPGDPPFTEVGPANTFYVHPTTYLDRDRWNAPIALSAEADSRTNLFVRSQSSAFNNAGRIWAPRYRQAAYGAFLLQSADATKALDLAYEDVAHAFDTFIAEVPAGSPIFIAGHSQGSLHVARLLREKVAGTPLADRVVAAYVVGWPLSLAVDIPAMGLPTCTSPDQARCILSWQSFADPANTALISDAYRNSRGPGGERRKLDDLLCTDPIGGTRGGDSPPSANLGTLIPSADLTGATLAPGLVGARCDQGFLKISGAIPPLGPYVLPGNNYHVYDYALFWGSIRADVARRLAAFER